MILISLSHGKMTGLSETVSFKMSQDFLRQVLITTFQSAHEADHYSAARFRKCDTMAEFSSLPLFE